MTSLVCGLVCVACSLPGPDAEDAARPALVRDTLSTSGSEPAIELSFLRAGDPDAPRILFLHGTPGSAEMWSDYLVEPLAGFEAIAVDRPGFGRTRPRSALPALVDQARVLAPLLVSRRGQLPILVGHSLGAPIAVQAAVDFPDRVGGLVLIAGSLDPDLERVLWIQRFGRWSRLDWLLPSWAHNANHELVELETHLRELAPRLEAVRCPVIIVHGTEDTLVPYANVGFMLRSFAANTGVELVRLQGQNHFLPWNSEPIVRSSILRASALGADFVAQDTGAHRIGGWERRMVPGTSQTGDQDVSFVDLPQGVSEPGGRMQLRLCELWESEPAGAVKAPARQGEGEDDAWHVQRREEPSARSRARHRLGRAPRGSVAPSSASLCRRTRHTSISGSNTLRVRPPWTN